MKNRLIVWLKILYRIAKNAVMLIGLSFSAILTMWSIYLLKGGTIDKIGNINLQTFFKDSSYPYIWISIFIVFTIGFFIECGYMIYKMVKEKHNIGGK